MCSACRLMVFIVCVKFHEKKSRGFKSYGADTKIVNRHTHTEKRLKHYTPWHTSYAGGIISICLITHVNQQ